MMKDKPTGQTGEPCPATREKDQVPLQRSEPSLVSLRRILVPIDFSDCSKEALRCAVPFARHFGASLLALHVVQPAYPADPCLINQYEQFESSLVESSKSWLAQLLLAMVPSEVPVQAFVRTGHPATEIVHVAREMRADMVIISTHGYTGIKHVVFGSTAENVVRHCPCPVLTMRVNTTN
jgi:nucleotide-binding universal stress UspA family protein